MLILSYQIFFHSYFVGKHVSADAAQSKAEVRRSKKRDREDSTDEEDGEADEAAEDGSELDSGDESEIWNAMKSSMPKPDMDALDDEAPSDFEEDDDVSLDMESSEAEEEETVANQPPTQDSDDDGFEGFDEEPEDLVDSDAEMNIVLGGGEEEDEASKADPRQRKKRKLKHLPLFGIAEDYAKLLGGSDDEEL